MEHPQTPPTGKTQRAYEWISQRIADGTLGPGKRLVLASIAAELDVSVVPVREALRRLEAEGSVTFVRNVGAAVAMPDPHEYLAVMETLAVVEAAATRIAAPLLDEEHLERARRTNEKMRRLAGSRRFDPERFTRLNKEFHEILFGPCPNTYLTETVHRCWARLDVLRTSTFSFVPDRANESVREHDALLALLGTGRHGDELEQVARQHRLATVQAYLDRDVTS